MKQSKPDIEMIDLEKYTRISEGAQFLTVSAVEKIEAEINVYYREERYDEFMMHVDSYCDQANALAAAIKQGIEPYYKSLIDQNGMSFSNIVDEMADAERYYNGIILKRNAAWVMKAECLLKLGKNDLAVGVLSSVLDSMTLIGFEEFKLWTRARNMLWNLVGYEKR